MNGTKISWTKGQGAYVADGAIASYRTQIAGLESERASIASHCRAVQAELAATLAEIAAAFLPDAAPATLFAAGQALGMPWISQRRADLERKRIDWQGRLAQIEREPAFIRRQALLRATTGEIAVERLALQRWKAELEQRAEKFEHPSFKWLCAREEVAAAGRGALASFWDAVTFSGLRTERAKSTCVADLGFRTYEELTAEFTRTRAELEQAHARLVENESMRQRTLALLEEHATLYGWIHAFESRVCELLRNEVAVTLGRCDLRGLHGRVDPSARVRIAKAHAQTHKLEYLGNLERYLAGQIDDRNHRVGAIAKTQREWAKRPASPIAGDKKGWLVDLPATKQRSTDKSVRLSRRMHQAIHSFEDYDDYSFYLGRSQAFLPYDAFAWNSHESMPYEGWTRAVVPSLAEYREVHGQHRADHGFFRAADRELEREQRAAERDERERQGREAAQDAGELDIARDDAADLDAEGASSSGDLGDVEDFSDAEAGLETDSTSDLGGDDVS